MRHLWLFLLLTSCGPKAVSPFLIYDGLTTTTAIVQHPMDSRDPIDAPPDLQRGVAELLAGWGASSSSVLQTTYGEAFARRRTSAHRVSWLVDTQAEADLVLLVETEARFFSQLQGRFRWVVDVNATIADVAHPEEALTSTFAVPVFLQFQHQREGEAIAASTPVVVRRLASMLDDFSGRLPGSSSP